MAQVCMCKSMNSPTATLSQTQRCGGTSLYVLGKVRYIAICVYKFMNLRFVEVAGKKEKQLRRLITTPLVGGAK